MTRRLLLVCLFLLPGCNQTPPSGQPAPLRAEARREHFDFSVEIAPPEPVVGDPIEITLVAHTPPDYAVAFPEDAAFDTLEISTAESDEPQATDDGRIRWVRTLRGEQFVSGPLEIPGLRLAYGIEDIDGELVVENDLFTDPIALEVRSVLTSQDAVTAPRDITGTRLPDPPPWTAAQWALAILVALTAFALLAWAARWLIRRLTAPAPPVPPEVRARDALARLRGDEWFTAERIRDWHYRLSEVVRTYIEDQFGLAAPDMTTEEFLRSLATIGRGSVPAHFVRGPAADRAAWQILRRHAAPLETLLEHCDRVKYSSFVPSPDDARETWRTASAFVDETAERIRQHRRQAAEQAEVAA